MDFCWIECFLFKIMSIKTLAHLIWALVAKSFLPLTLNKTKNTFQCWPPRSNLYQTYPHLFTLIHTISTLSTPFSHLFTPFQPYPHLFTLIHTFSYLSTPFKPYPHRIDLIHTVSTLYTPFQTYPHLLNLIHTVSTLFTPFQPYSNLLHLINTF